MKKSILALVILISFSFVYCQDEKKVMETKIKNFKVEIIRYYFGRENIRIIVTHEQLMCETALSLNQKDYALVKRILTDEESSEMEELLAGFPLEKFKEKYYNKGVKDGMQIRFIISIDGIEKNIFVANYYIKELGSLTSAITDLLSEDHLNYNINTVSATIEK